MLRRSLVNMSSIIKLSSTAFLSHFIYGSVTTRCRIGRLEAHNTLDVFLEIFDGYVVHTFPCATARYGVSNGRKLCSVISACRPLAISFRWLGIGWYKNYEKMT